MQALLLSGMWDLSSLAKEQTSIKSNAKQFLNHWTTKGFPIFTF